MRNLLFALFIAACSLSAQEKPYLLEYTVEVASSNTICGWNPCRVDETRYKRFESAEAAIKWMHEGYEDGSFNWDRMESSQRFVALYRTEKLPVEVATETTTKERVVVDEEHETVYRLEGREFRKAKPETASGASISDPSNVLEFRVITDEAVFTIPKEWSGTTQRFETGDCTVGSTDPDHFYRCTSTGTRSLEIREGDILKYNGTNQR